MRSLLLALLAAALYVLAFPPFGWTITAVFGVALFLYAVRIAPKPGTAWLIGAGFGLFAFGGLLWFFSKLGLVAVVPLVLLQAAYMALLSRLLFAFRNLGNWVWWLAATGAWAAMELTRDNFPLGGFSFGALGYSVSNNGLLRQPAHLVGVAGLGILLAALAAALSIRKWRLLLVAVVLLSAFTGWAALESPSASGTPVRVAVVQGSTPCPFEHCDNERLLTLQQHLTLTSSIPAGSVDLVVWAEGSTGARDADPILVPAVAQAIGAEARRIGAYLLAGGDRPVSDLEWINANVLFDPRGAIVGEYRKRHPVPFGEYVPARRFFTWVQELAAVPRDMIRGEGPVVFETGFGRLGSVISFEGGFARYPRETVEAGARLLVIATNEASYDRTPASDVFIGITRMRAVETGVEVVHAAVTGRSVIVDRRGALSDITDLGTSEILQGTVVVTQSADTLFVRWGNWFVWLVLAGAFVAVVTSKKRRPPGEVAAVSGSKP